jgi:hypothetical protein
MAAFLEAKPIEPVIELSAWSAPFFRSPSQRSIGWLIELKIVGECREVSAPRASGEKRRLSAPQSRAKWQLPQAVLPSVDSLGSQKMARPSSACADNTSGPPFICPKRSLASRRKASSAPAAPGMQTPNTAIHAATMRIFMLASFRHHDCRQAKHTRVPPLPVGPAMSGLALDPEAAVGLPPRAARACRARNAALPLGPP